MSGRAPRFLEVLSATRPVTVLALVQVFLIVASFLVAGFFMKLHGYPDGRPWPAGPVFFRENVFYLLLLTLLWTGSALFAATHAGRLYRGFLIAGALFALALAFYGVTSSGSAAAGPKRPLAALPDQ